MKIASEASASDWLSWTGVETSFNCGLQALLAAYVGASFRDGGDNISTLTAGVHFAVALDAAGNASAVPLAMPPAPGAIRFIRTTPATKPVDLIDLSSYSAAFSDTLYAAAVFRDQELRRQLTEGVTVNLVADAGDIGFADAEFVAGNVRDALLELKDDVDGKSPLGHNHALASLSDVNVTLGAGVDQYRLAWDNASHRFILEAQVVLTGPNLVALLNSELGGTVWQSGDVANGEANVGSNLGSGGALAIYAGKSGIQLQFYGVRGNNGVVATFNGATNSVDFSFSTTFGDARYTLGTDHAALAAIVAGLPTSAAPVSADYLVKTANAGLSAERAVTDTVTISWDWSAAGVAKANVVDASMTFAKLAASAIADNTALDAATAADKLATVAGIKRMIDNAAAATGKIVGETFAWPGTRKPAHSEWCDGGAFNKVDNAALYAALVDEHTVTVSIANPAVFTWAAHGLDPGARFKLRTTGALPTGLAVDTYYYVIAGGIGASTFRASATPGGAAIVTSGAQSGVHTIMVSPHGVNAGGTVANRPDYKDAALIGRGNMGGTDAGLVTAAGSGLDGTVLGLAGGAETVALTGANNGPHGHVLNNPSAYEYNGVAGGSTPVAGGGYHLIIMSINDSGSGTPHQNMPPSKVTNWCIYTGI